MTSACAGSVISGGIRIGRCALPGGSQLEQARVLFRAIALERHLGYECGMETNKETDKADLGQRLAAITDFLAAQKTEDIFVHRFKDCNPVADAIVVATASSRRHAQGLADNLLRLCPGAGRDFLRMEGYDAAQWILVDCNDIIVHIFQADARDFYKLEDLCRQTAASGKEIHS